jgi:hypothetical protein
MFDFFRKREYTTTPPVPYIESKEKEPQSAYKLGMTDSNTYMTLTVGYTTVTMTKQGCQNLIDQLEVFKNSLDDSDD